MKRAEVAARIEHTLLRPEARAAEIRALCDQALELGCGAVCVHGSRLSLAVERLAGRPVRVVTVAGFPLGAGATSGKACEAAWARDEGADEIDMVLNIGALKDADTARVLDDIAAVVEAAGEAPVKVILETGLLTDDEKCVAADLVVQAGAAYCKTSTGFSRGGATPADVRLLKRALSGRARIKASGGIRDAATALALLSAGADRLGVSRTGAILGGVEP